MTNKYNREFLLEYVESENKKNECNVSLENMNKIVSLIEVTSVLNYIAPLRDCYFQTGKKLQNVLITILNQIG